MKHVIINHISDPLKVVVSLIILFAFIASLVASAMLQVSCTLSRGADGSYSVAPAPGAVEGAVKVLSEK